MSNSNPAMKFEGEYPNAFAHFITDDGFMKGSGQTDECACCEEPTAWFHKVLGLYFCSRACYARYEDRERCRERGPVGECI